jgi:hypothetical protein
MANVRCRTHAGSLFHRIPKIGSMICAVRILAALILSLGFTGTSYAAHPLVTDDTGTQGKGKFQFELNGEFRRDKGAQDGIFIREDAGESAAAFSAGITDNVDVVVNFPWVYSQVKENGTLVSNASGFGDMALEAKWRFFAREGFSLAVKPGFSVPTGSEEKGFGNGRVSYGVTVILQQEWEGFFLSANGAYTRNEFRLEADRQTNRRDIWQANAAAGVEVVTDLKAVANIGVETNSDRTSSQWPAFLLGGVIYSVTDAIDIDVGAKWGLNRSEPIFAVLAGIAWRF